MAGQRQGRLRIVAGRWRGRRFPVPPVDGLRPTPDRIRETLFNWLGPAIDDTRCLDLFAGSGALGLEALSRGATEVVAVERDHAAVMALRTVGEEFQAKALSVYAGDALAYLRQPARPFDVVFLDPPFARGLLETVQVALLGGWLASPAWVYLESELDLAGAALPEGWREHRASRAGEVACRLVRVE